MSTRKLRETLDHIDMILDNWDGGRDAEDLLRRLKEIRNDVAEASQRSETGTRERTGDASFEQWWEQHCVTYPNAPHGTWEKQISYDAWYDSRQKAGSDTPAPREPWEVRLALVKIESICQHQSFAQEPQFIVNEVHAIARAALARQAGSDTPAPREAIAEGDEVWVRCKVAHLQSEPLNQQEHIEVGYPSGQGFAFFAKREDIRAADQTPRASSEGPKGAKNVCPICYHHFIDCTCPETMRGDQSRASSQHEYVGGIQDEDSEIYSCCSCGWKCQGPLPGCHEKWLRHVADAAQTTPPPSEGRER